MPESAYGLIEMALSFGVVLAFLIWQLIRTRQGLRADRERAERESSNRDTP
jgi:hypothetical protein